MRPAEARGKQLIVEGPRGQFTLDAGVLRLVWKYSGFGDVFPGARRAARRLHPGAVVRLAVTLVVAAWAQLVSAPVPARVPVPAAPAQRRDQRRRRGTCPGSHVRADDDRPAAPGAGNPSGSWPV